MTTGGRHMGRKGKGRKSKGRKSKGRKGQGRKGQGRKGQGPKRKSEWWSENFFAIRDLIWAIYFRVEEPDPAKPSLDDLFRKLRARIDTFEVQCWQCWQKGGGTLMARTRKLTALANPTRRRRLHTWAL